MAGGQKKTPERGLAQPGRGNRSAMAAGTAMLSAEMQHAKRSGAYRIAPNDGGEAFTIFAKGRVAWALDRLRAAGANGCTPLNEPAPRWSHYVHVLRGMGVPVETIRELHGGKYPGAHGRYVIRATVSPCNPVGGANE